MASISWAMSYVLDDTANQHAAWGGQGHVQSGTESAKREGGRDVVRTIRLFVVTKCWRVTDGQTDRHKGTGSRYTASHSRDKNKHQQSQMDPRDPLPGVHRATSRRSWTLSVNV